MKKTILFVDDEPDKMDICVEFLTNKGYKVHFFQDPKEALFQFLTIKPDLVILDVNMPNLSGFEIANTIRGKNPNIPILFLSGTPGHENAIKGLKIGANDYIRKDTHLEELYARIKKELDRNIGKSWERLTLTADTYIEKSTKKLVSCGFTHKFSEKEFQILVELADNVNTSVDRTYIIKKILDERLRSDDYLYKTITKLRSALKNDKSIKLEAISGSISLQVNNEC
ncbi:MAG: response regulator transcription factor [Bacteroidales bacterium]